MKIVPLVFQFNSKRHNKQRHLPIGTIKTTILTFILTLSFVLLSDKVAEGAEKPTNVICANASGTDGFEIGGVVYFIEWTYFIVYDRKVDKHLVYRLPSSKVFTNLNLVLLKDAELHYMERYFGYEPAKQKHIVKSAFGLDNSLIYLLYGFGNAKIDVINLQKKTHWTILANDSNLGAVILNHVNQGMAFYRRQSTWYMRDVEFVDGTAWYPSKWGQMGWAQTTDKPQYYVFYVEQAPDVVRPSDVNDIDFSEMFSGFKSLQSIITLFHKGNVYNFHDPWFPHGNYPHLRHRLKVHKISIVDYFSCDDSFKINVDISYQEPLTSNTKLRAWTIFYLFMLHFVLASVMIVLIVLYSNRTTRPQLLRLIRRKHQSKTNNNLHGTSRASPKAKPSSGTGGSKSPQPTIDNIDSSSNQSNQGSQISETKSNVSQQSNIENNTPSQSNQGSQISDTKSNPASQPSSSDQGSQIQDTQKSRQSNN